MAWTEQTQCTLSTVILRNVQGCALVLGIFSYISIFCSLYCTVPCYTVLHCMYCTVLYSTVLYCTYCTVLRPATNSQPVRQSVKLKYRAMYVDRNCITLIGMHDLHGTCYYCTKSGGVHVHVQFLVWYDLVKYSIVLSSTE